MTMLRSAVVVSGLLGAGSASPRSALGAQNSVQIVGAGGMSWSKKAVFLKNSPYTIEHPHKGQLEIRSKFGHAAQSAKGQGMTGELPPAAERVRQALTGQRMPDSLAKENYPSYNKRTFHTLAQIDAMLNKVAGRATGF